VRVRAYSLMGGIGVSRKRPRRRHHLHALSHPPRPPGPIP
jgi:hypothetical protein